MTKHGLGRGFESLIPTELVDDDFDPTASEDAKKLLELKLDDVIRDEEQPRKDFSEASLKELSDSIKQHGVLSPIVVVKSGDKYQIVAGERRWRAAKLAGLKTIPAIVRTLDAQNRLELSIIENAQREDLNAIELATAYAKLKTQFNMSNADIGARVGKAEATITNILRLLKLPEEAKKAMQEHHIREGVMRPLISADPEIVKAALPRLVKEDWTARQTEQFVATHKKKSSARAMKSDTYKKQEVSLQEKYGLKVRITSTKLTFSCKNEKELKDLIDKL